MRSSILFLTICVLNFFGGEASATINLSFLINYLKKNWSTLGIKLFLLQVLNDFFRPYLLFTYGENAHRSKSKLIPPAFTHYTVQKKKKKKNYVAQGFFADLDYILAAKCKSVFSFSLSRQVFEIQ